MKLLGAILFLCLSLGAEILSNYPELGRGGALRKLPNLPKLPAVNIPGWTVLQERWDQLIKLGNPLPENEARAAVISIARKEIGVQESSGRNDGEVEKYIRSVGMDSKAGHPYCAAFIYWCGKQAGQNIFPRSAWSPDFLKNPDWVKGRGEEPQAGDVFGIYYRSKKRIAHCGFIDNANTHRGRLGGRQRMVRTIEANTSPRSKWGSAADREGHGVHSKYRSLQTIHSIKNWFTD